ncbi:hypothetical protein ACQJBY_022335 [Aegilops geniculata]
MVEPQIPSMPAREGQQGPVGGGDTDPVGIRLERPQEENCPDPPRLHAREQRAARMPPWPLPMEVPLPICSPPPSIRSRRHLCGFVVTSCAAATQFDPALHHASEARTATLASPLTLRPRLHGPATIDASSCPDP